MGIEIVCSCGRKMERLSRSNGWRCGCGHTLRAVYHWADASTGASGQKIYSQSCRVRIGGMICGNKLIPKGNPAGGMACQDCALRVLEEALQGEATRAYAREFFADWEISEVRKRLALEQFEQKRAEQEARKADAASAHVVYYVRLGENHVKIGTTGRLEERMRELRVANRVNLLAAEPGDRTVEKRRHRQFTILRYDSRKEDFAESPRLLGHIKDIRNRWGDPWQLPARLLAGGEGGELVSA